MAPGSSRRRFLKTAALSGAGVLIGAGGLNALSPCLWRRQLALDRNASFWSRAQAAQNPKLMQERDVDVAIIGGGLTGLSSAYYIRRTSPAKSVVVLEAMGCGNGASGRNGAMLLTLTADRYVNLSARPAMDRTIYDLTVNNIHALAALSAATGIDCELQTTGALQVFESGSDAKATSLYVQQARALGMPVEFWDGRRTAAAIGTEVYEGAFYDPNGGHVQPMKLVHVFKSAAQGAGATIYENTLVEHLEEGRVHLLHLAGGITVRAKSVVLASNVFTPNLGYFRNSILPVREYNAMTRPLSERELAEIGWQSRAPFNDSNTETYYFGLTSERRIHVGGGSPRYDFDNRPSAPGEDRGQYALLRRELVRVFPRLADIDFEVTWNGLIDWSLDAAPSVGYTGRHNNIFYGLGYSGHGVNLSSVFGRIIADLEAGREEAWNRYPFFNASFYYVPNEPFRWLGAKAGLAWYELPDPNPKRSSAS